MPSCSASESDSKIRPANFQTRHKPPVRNYRRIQTEEAVCNLQTASSHHPRHSIDLGPIGSPSIRSLFPVIRGRILSGRISSDTKHSKTPARSGSGLCLFSLFRRDRLRQLRKNTDMHPLVGNNLIEKLDSYCGRLCQLFGIVFRIRSINC